MNKLNRGYSCAPRSILVLVKIDEIIATTIASFRKDSKDGRLRHQYEVYEEVFQAYLSMLFSRMLHCLGHLLRSEYLHLLKFSFQRWSKSSSKQHMKTIRVVNVAYFVPAIQPSLIAMVYSTSKL